MNDLKPKLALIWDDLLGRTFFDVVSVEGETFYFFETGVKIPDGLKVKKFCDLEEAGQHLQDEEYDGRFKWDVVSI